MQTQIENIIEKPVPTILLPPASQTTPILDDCSNCPDSSCCPFANDSFRGSASYDE